jgi:hyperosmotically inducible periplasmic protein
MTTRRATALAAAAALAVAACGGDRADRQATTKGDTSSARQGTENRQGAPTAMSQSESERDRETTRRIRQALVNDKSLSTDAKNVTIATAEGTVTLRGTVNGADEKTAVEARAREAAGGDKVKSEIEVAAR